MFHFYEKGGKQQEGAPRHTDRSQGKMPLFRGGSRAACYGTPYLCPVVPGRKTKQTHQTHFQKRNFVVESTSPLTPWRRKGRRKGQRQRTKDRELKIENERTASREVLQQMPQYRQESSLVPILLYIQMVKNNQLTKKTPKHSHFLNNVYSPETCF